ncbi:hypothetical protein [Treponema sp. R6D11]
MYFSKNLTRRSVELLVRKYASFVVLLLMLLFAGCEEEPEPTNPIEQFDTRLVGTWTCNSSGYIDGYIITSNHITYANGNTLENITSAGTIKYTSQFTSDSGVIIIEYDSDHKASYSDWTQNPPTSLPLKGDFIGIYYKNLVPGVSVDIGGAYVDGGAEEATLANAKAAFTVDNEGTYMSYYGRYLKQP